jgi:type IV pilus assembly protein PilA
MLRKLRKTRGFTLVELMIVVAIIGVLAALAVYGVRRYLLNSKTAEAKMILGRIGKDASSAYQRERMAGGLIAVGGQRNALHAFCADSNKVPATPPPGGKYQSNPTDWTTGNARAGWICLKFSLSEPQYFSYQYQSATTAGAGAVFTATANGDLDGDTTASTFGLNGALNASMEVMVAPTISETNPEE